MGLLQDSIELAKFVSRFANPELLQRVNVLNEQILEVTTQNIEFRERNTQLQDELRQAQDKLQLIEDVERRNGFIYRKGKSEPCCSRCFDVDRRLVHIIEARGTKTRITSLCPQCKMEFVLRPEGLPERKVDPTLSSMPTAASKTSGYL